MEASSVVEVKIDWLRSICEAKGKSILGFTVKGFSWYGIPELSNLTWGLNYGKSRSSKKGSQKTEEKCQKES